MQSQYKNQQQRSQGPQPAQAALSSSAPRKIFRDKALHHYMRKKERDVLPHGVQPFLFVWFWTLLMLAALIAVFVGLYQQPVQVLATGVLLNPHTQSNTTQQVQAVFFLPITDDSSQLTTGEHLQIRASGQHNQSTGTISQISTNTITPTQAQQRFALSQSAQFITQPSHVLIVTFDQQTGARFQTLQQTQQHGSTFTVHTTLQVATQPLWQLILNR
jgi:hypothetical protein